MKKLVNKNLSISKLAKNDTVELSRKMNVESKAQHGRRVEKAPRKLVKYIRKIGFFRGS
jgi:hypothetical protein